MKYMIVKESLDSRIQISIQRATQLLGVSRCGFYKWLGQSKTGQVNAIPDMDVRNEIQKIAVEFPAYGYRRITAELRNRGYSVNHKRVLRLMSEDNLLCVRKDFKPKNHRFQARSQGLSQSCEGVEDNPIESGMGFRYHLYQSIGRIRLPGGNPGPLQQKMHRMESG